jgi:hypothetical protein
MGLNIPQTALRGRSQSAADRVAQGLGLFSIGLGLVELLAPRAVSRAVGLRHHEGVVRAYGAREIATGIAILTSHDATPWIWGRVAGDAADIATVLLGASDRGRDRENRDLALAALIGVTAIDVLCATALTAEKGGRRTARADYGDRSGFPQGIRAARGGARDFRTPRDIKGPEALRPWGRS